jgi:hypothetical protein
VPAARIGVVVVVLVVCGAIAAFVVRAAVGHGGQPKPLSTMMASQQPVGLAGAGPQASSPQLLLAPGAGGALAFLNGGASGAVQGNQQWQADHMTDGSYVLVYVPDGKCLGAPSSPGGTARPQLQSCDLQVGQRWSHPYLGKDPAGRDYWQLRSMAAGQCLAAAGGNWANGTATVLQACSRSMPWQQLVAFWSAY